MIKLESFAMPSNISLSSYQMLNNRDMFNSRDMCISPALLDFLEQTLEPFDNLIKAAQAAQSGAGVAGSGLNTSNAKASVVAMNTLSNRTMRDSQRASTSILMTDNDDDERDTDNSGDDDDRTELDQTIQFSHDGTTHDPVSLII